MAKELSKSGISTGQDILAGHVTQSVDALTGTEAYDVTVSGSLTITGSTFIQPTNVSTGTNVLTVDSDGKIYKTGSYSAGGGGTTPTWQQVTDQGASTTNDLTITGNITASDLTITSSNFAVIAKGAGDDIIHLAAGSDSDIYIKGDDYIRLNNNQIRITGSITASADISASGNLSGDRIIVASYVQTPVVNSATNVVRIDDSLNVVGQITASGNISSSGIVYGETGSFSHLQGNSPITVGDSTTFQQSITASGDISASGFLFITASKLDPASQILTFNTESGAVHYANFHISTSTSTNTIGDDNTDLDFKGPNVSVIAADDHKVTAKQSLYQNPLSQTVHSADYENEIFKWGQNSVTISASAGHISASGNITASELFLSDGKNGIKIYTHESAYNPPNSYGGNVSIGAFAGKNLSDDDLGNVIIGNRAGYTTTNNYNVFIGYKTGYEQPGGNNIFIGSEAGYYGDTLNQHNVAIGYEALRGISSSNHDSQNNVVIGYRAGKYVQNGNENIILGPRSGFDITDGNHNIIIGPYAASGSGNIDSKLFIGSGSLATISASLVTGDIVLQGDVSSSVASTASFGQYKGQKLEIRGIGGGLSSGYIADSAGAGDMKFGIGTDSPTEVLDVAGGIKASMDLTARNATFSGSLVVSGSSSILMTSGSSTQTFGVGGYYKTRWGQSDADFTFFSDDYINLLWNEGGTDDIEGEIKTNPSSGEVHIITNNDGAYTYLDRQVSDGVFDIDSNLGNDENLEFTIGSPMDNSYPFYRVTIRSANTAGAGAGVTCLIEKFT